MAAPPARARADYDYLIKLLLIGDSGMCFPLLFFFIFFLSDSFFKFPKKQTEADLCRSHFSIC